MISVDQVRSALGIPPSDATDDAWLTTVTTGVNTWIQWARPDLIEPWDAHIEWGALQLATRWYGRRNGDEISSFTELGGPPPAVDRDIQAALGLGYWQPPVVA